MPAGNTQIRWLGDKFLREFRDTIIVRMVKLGEESVDSIRHEISVMAPPHSAAGEPPHKITGELSDGMHSEVREEGGDVVLKIGSTAGHTVALELGTRKMAARPFLLPWLYEVAGKKAKKSLRRKWILKIN